jgi:polygalacturonase
MKKSIILISAVATTLISCNQQKPDPMADAFAQAQAMAKGIIVPDFCKDTLNIESFGAKQDGTAIETQSAIMAAIDSANAIGGASVLVPAGTWLTGPIELKSNVQLIVDKGATLKFSTDYNHYLPAVLTRWEGVDCYNLKPLIYAYNQTNVGISGKGIIDGQGSENIWWFMKGRAEYGWKEGLISQELGGRDRLLEADRNQTPVEERQMTIEDGLRPQLINIYKCNNVVIEGVTLRNSPFWVIHPLMVNGLTVRNVTIESHGPNSDGCDPESCQNVLIEDCFFDTGDDCIAIKSGRNQDGRRWAMPSENIYVRNCRMKNGHGGVVLGSEISGGYKNLWVENCKMSSPELDRVIRIKTSDCRGGVIENVWVRDIEVGECREAVLKINLKYEPKEVCNRDFPPVVKNINLQNITSQKSKYGAYIIGLENTQNVDGITIRDCNFNGVEDGNKITDATNIVFDNLKINGNIVTQ